MAAPSMAYGASKIAVSRWVRRNAVTRAWAQAGIRLNALAPGAVMTPLLQQQLATPQEARAIKAFPVPVGGFGDPDQMADWMLFMLSDAADFLCGSVVFVDGGSDAYFRADDWPRPVPARGLIGLRTRVLNATQGEGIIHHRFEGYKPLEGDVPGRANGVLVSMVSGKAVAFGLDGLQERSELFIGPGTEVYEGMIVGENSRDNDMPVNPCKEKKLTNVRASGSDENIILKPPREMTLEVALEYIAEDELVEVTPKKTRLRKVLLREADRRRKERQLVG